MSQTILVATDFGESAEHATHYAVDLAQKIDARIHLVHAFALPIFASDDLVATVSSALFEALEKDAKQAMDAAVARHTTVARPVTGTVLMGDARSAVVDFAQSLKADLLVVGTHGRKGLKRALMGSVAEGLVRSAPCPVLVVR